MAKSLAREAGRIDWHRFAPADEAVAEGDHDHAEEAEGFEVHDGVEGNAAEVLRRVVTEAPSGVGMHEFVDGGGNDEADQDGDDLLSRGQRATVQ